MKFVWDMTEEKYDVMIQEMIDSVTNNDMEDDYYGCVRAGEICVDILRTGSFQEYSLFVGGVDSGYGYSSYDALQSGKYETKWQVPDELQHPYDHVDYLGGYGLEINQVSFEEFKRESEKKITEWINEVNKIYSERDLVAEANKPLHIW